MPIFFSINHYSCFPFYFSQVFFLLKIGVVLENLSVEVKQHAIELAEVVLACTPTSGLINVLKLAFGKYEPEEPTYPPEADPSMTMVIDEETGAEVEGEASEQKDDLPEGAISARGDPEPEPSASTSSKTSLKRKTRSGKVSAPKRAKEEIPPDEMDPLIPNLYSAEITVYYPTVERHSEHHIGVANSLVGSREEFGDVIKHWRYRCEFWSNAQEVGYTPREEDLACRHWQQQSSACVTHIRKCHLGIALGCLFCDFRTYGGAQWKAHMKKMHSSKPENAWYATEKDAVRQGERFEVTGEVAPEEVISQMKAEQD